MRSLPSGMRSQWLPRLQTHEDQRIRDSRRRQPLINMPEFVLVMLCRRAQHRKITIEPRVFELVLTHSTSMFASAIGCRGQTQAPWWMDGPALFVAVTCNFEPGRRCAVAGCADVSRAGSHSLTFQSWTFSRQVTCLGDRPDLLGRRSTRRRRSEEQS